MRFHHIGVACADSQKMLAWIERTHDIVERQGPVFDAQQNATLVMLRTRDGLEIELISGEMVKTIVKRGLAFYHICYAVDDLEASIRTLSESGAMLISPAKKTVLFGGKQVAFLQTPMGIIELLEQSP
jgi:methylmalonyl-CoA/ethylmalonyl-CoA epimerase